MFDLLNGRKKLNILEDGKKQVCVVGLKVSKGATRGRVCGLGPWAMAAPLPACAWQAAVAV